MPPMTHCAQSALPHERLTGTPHAIRFRGLRWVLLPLVGTAMGCSLLAPTDEELFGNKGTSGTGGVATAAAPLTAGTGAR